MQQPADRTAEQPGRSCRALAQCVDVAGRGVAAPRRHRLTPSLLLPCADLVELGEVVVQRIETGLGPKPVDLIGFRQWRGEFGLPLHTTDLRAVRLRIALGD